MKNSEYIEKLTVEDREIHLHYMVEFLEENLQELYENLSGNLHHPRALKRMSFLEEVSDRIERMNEKPIQ